VKVAQPIEAQPVGTGDPLSQPLAVTTDSSTETDTGDPIDSAQSLQARCDNMQPPSSYCESFEDTKQTCRRFAEALNPDMAADTVDCITGKGGAVDVCSYDAAGKCFVAALQNQPPSKAHRKRCDSMVRACANYRWKRGDLTADNCMRAMASVGKPGQARLASCMAESCGIGNCVYGYPQGAAQSMKCSQLGRRVVKAPKQQEGVFSGDASGELVGDGAIAGPHVVSTHFLVERSQDAWRSPFGPGLAYRGAFGGGRYEAVDSGLICSQLGPGGGARTVANRGRSCSAC